MKIVAALGGNALLRRVEPMELEIQRTNAASAARVLGDLVGEHQLIVTHGNGPQVGLLALQAEAYQEVRPYPLDVLDAESQGMIGYLLELGLRNQLPDQNVGVLLTQTVVDPDDPAFGNPTKPVGPTYPEQLARRLAAERGWTVSPDGSYFRRVVPSPEPRDIVELKTIRFLVDQSVVVICTGGGGVPVVVRDGEIAGVEAVVDKDLASALLARMLAVDFLLILTDVPAVQLDWGTPDARPIESATPAELRKHTFASGSMGPKVEAACRFVEATNGRAAIGSLVDADRIVRGEAGTAVVPG